MRFLTLAVTLMQVVIGVARPIDEPAPPAFMIMTAREPGTQGTQGTTNLPNYDMLILHIDTNQRGQWYHIDRIMVKYSTCMAWIDVDKLGGISSLESFKNQQGLPFYCFNYASTDCSGDTYWWKGVIRLDSLPSNWDNKIRSTRCHHGRFPDDIPPPDAKREEATLLVGSTTHEPS
ncbi:hypothetical protein DPSP01_008708 [Paraphaeosphaeria sporulosa]|uniref:Uncharacterized protein n=1 Tax=Paraphaeosphaeria sporulosa TaxID=1460663 RepID=A0A177BZC1_9PLEO|nr:uncharacterized protein CC84DRAFT_1263322 [Paraphaeosphaeria sporulosa]OAG00331.1 hypothetical protein CC84DRAFT_1263322 [Paraphaeosphaeria sporulosa]